MFSTSVLWEFWEKGQFAHDGKTKYYHSVYYVKQLNDKNYIYNEKDQKDFFSESLSMCRLIMVTIQWMVLMLMGQTQATDTCGDPKPKPAVDLLALPPSVFSKASRLPMHSRSPSRSSPWVMRLTGSTDEELIQSSHSAANLPSHCPHKNCRSKIEFWAYCHSFFLSLLLSVCECSRRGWEGLLTVLCCGVHWHWLYVQLIVYFWFKFSVIQYLWDNKWLLDQPEPHLLTIFHLHMSRQSKLSHQ